MLRWLDGLRLPCHAGPGPVKGRMLFIFRMEGEGAFGFKPLRLLDLRVQRAIRAGAEPLDEEAAELARAGPAVVRRTVDDDVVGPLEADLAGTEERAGDVRGQAAAHGIEDALERITHEYIARQDWTVARSYAGQALGTGFSPGRFLVWLRCMWHQMLTSG